MEEEETFPAVCSHCEREFDDHSDVNPCSGICGLSFCATCSLITYPPSSSLPLHLCFDCSDSSKRASTWEDLEKCEPPSLEERASSSEWERIVQGHSLPSPAIVAIANLSGFLTLLQEISGKEPPPRVQQQQGVVGEGGMAEEKEEEEEEGGG